MITKTDYECPQCNGTGQVFFNLVLAKDCPRCGGSGRISTLSMDKIPDPKPITADTPIWSYNQVKKLLEDMKYASYDPLASMAEEIHNGRLNSDLDKQLATLKLLYEAHLRSNKQ